MSLIMVVKSIILDRGSGILDSSLFMETIKIRAVLGIVKNSEMIFLLAADLRVKLSSLNLKIHFQQNSFTTLLTHYLISSTTFVTLITCLASGKMGAAETFLAKYSGKFRRTHSP